MSHIWAINFREAERDEEEDDELTFKVNLLSGKKDNLSNGK